jgi:hypothetical protein
MFHGFKNSVALQPQPEAYDRHFRRALYLMGVSRASLGASGSASHRDSIYRYEVGMLNVISPSPVDTDYKGSIPFM